MYVCPAKPGFGSQIPGTLDEMVPAKACKEDIMPKIKVNGVSIAYEVAGEGPPIVWTGGGWFPRDPYTFVLAGRLSARYKVLT